nr:hypothetical protein CPGR_00384 [Mycolicibacter nonchromogenicus]
MSAAADPVDLGADIEQRPIGAAQRAPGPTHSRATGNLREGQRIE